MPQPIDLTGKRFGKLVAKYATNNRKFGYRMWICHCDCGNILEVPNGCLTSNNSKSCGCVAKEINKKRMTTHGLSYTKQYKNFKEANRRTLLKGNDSDYKVEDISDILMYYGERCIYCNGKYEHLDHIIPISKGGSHTKNNLAPSCAKCNLSKHNKILWEQWNPPMNLISILNL